MKDIINDPFAEYMRQADPDRRKLAHAWHTGIGLQAVDRLETSAYLQQTARDNIEGKITLAEANDLITRYYEESPGHAANRYKEADLVSARIAAILSEEAFVFPYRKSSVSMPDFSKVYMITQESCGIITFPRRNGF